MQGSPVGMYTFCRIASVRATHYDTKAASSDQTWDTWRRLPRFDRRQRSARPPALVGHPAGL
jgi:hypothetical protein